MGDLIMKRCRYITFLKKHALFSCRKIGHTNSPNPNFPESNNYVTMIILYIIYKQITDQKNNNYFRVIHRTFNLSKVLSLIFPNILYSHMQACNSSNISKQNMEINNSSSDKPSNPGL